MHDLEPYFHWRDQYIAAEDPWSPFYQREYNEFFYSNKIYNYLIHPQWDEFGSATLYLKVLFTDYEEGFTIIELIGEWNDCLYNDIMYLKREVIDPMVKRDIFKFILICENVLNFHGSDDCYYEEWYEDIRDDEGWVCMFNTHVHVEEEMLSTRLQYYVNFGKHYSDINWRPHSPQALFKLAEALIKGEVQRLPG